MIKKLNRSISQYKWFILIGLIQLFFICSYYYMRDSRESYFSKNMMNNKHIKNKDVYQETDEDDVFDKNNNYYFESEKYREEMLKLYIFDYLNDNNISKTPNYGRKLMAKFNNIVFHGSNSEYIVYNGKEFITTHDLDTLGHSNSSRFYNILDSLDHILEYEEIMDYDFFSYNILPSDIIMNDKYHYYKNTLSKIDTEYVEENTYIKPKVGIIYIDDKYIGGILNVNDKEEKRFGLDISLLHPQLFPDPSLLSIYHDFVYAHESFQSLLYNNILYDLQQHMTLQLNTLESEDHPEILILSMDHFSTIAPYYSLITSRFSKEYSPIPGYVPIYLDFLKHIVTKECVDKMEHPHICRILSLLHIYLNDIIRMNDRVMLLLPMKRESSYVSQIKTLLS